MNIIKTFVLCTFFISHSLYAANKDDVNVPFSLAKGQALYELNCSSCHGNDLNGTKKGPPFLHSFYKPSHHGDGAFYRAALKGVTAHHWNFGNMPPVKGMTQSKVKSILAYIRFYQKQKNLF